MGCAINPKQYVFFGLFKGSISVQNCREHTGMEQFSEIRVCPQAFHLCSLFSSQSFKIAQFLYVHFKDLERNKLCKYRLNKAQFFIPGNMIKMKSTGEQPCFSLKEKGPCFIFLWVPKAEANAWHIIGLLQMF